MVVVGKNLLVPHVEIILKYLRAKLMAGTMKNRKTSPLSETELIVARGISELELNATQSQQLLEVLLPFLISSELKRETDLLKSLEIVMKLVTRVDETVLPGCVRMVVALFSRKFSRECRDMLCSILKVFPFEFVVVYG